MSEDEFHVHGPHDHQLEHAAEHGAGDRFAGRIAVTTAILATVGAMFSYQGGATQAEAQMRKNDAAIRKTEAADQWSYFQAKGNKQNLAELAATLVPAEKQDAYRGQVAKYEQQKDEIQKEATRLDGESKHLEEQSEAIMHEHHRWAQATTFLQIAIALSAIALLTRRRWLQWGVYGVATVGGIFGLLAFVHA